VSHDNPEALNDRACALWDRYDEEGVPELLDQAVELFRTGLRSTATVEALRLSLTVNLSGALVTRALRTGDTAELRVAAELARSAARATSVDDVHYAGRHTAVGSVLQQYFLRTGDTAVLRDAAAEFETALAATNPEACSVEQSNLAECLRQLYWLGRDPAVLGRGLTLAREAVRALPAADPLYPRFQANLALMLVDTYYADRNTQDGTAPALLREALAASRAARAGTPPGHPNEAERINGYARVLHELYLVTKQPRQLSDFRLAARRAVQVTPDGHPLRTGALWLRAIADYHDGANGNRAAAVTCRGWFRTIVLDTSLPVPERVAAARSWAAAALLGGNELAEALTAFGRAVELLPLTAGRQLDATDRERQVASFPNLASDAAACGLAANNPELALALLEQGRGVLIGQALDTWYDVTELARSRPDLADRFRSLVSTAAESGSQTGDAFQNSELRRHAVEEWARLLTTIRDTRGFAGFLGAPTIDELLAAGRSGPVVVVNVSMLRCDALIVDRSRLRVLPLPQMRADHVATRAETFAEAIDCGRDGTRSMAERSAAEDTVREILAWLWHTVTGPVLAELGLTGDREPLPRLWWVPTGALTLLPLHAAGDYPDPISTTGAAPTGDSALDRVVSSYSSTLRSLLHHRQRPATRTKTAPLVVAMAQTPGADPLPGAAREAALLHDEIWPDAMVLRDGDATRQAVLGALNDRDLVHFACHARSPVDASGTGHLLTHDHDTQPLTVRDIAALRLARADLAYLSACETTRSTLALADEAVHLTGAFQLAGFRHVVGTLWRTADDIAVRMAESVHRTLAVTGTEGAARAVHAATQRERRSAPSVPTQWSGYLHVGI
jgi:hypothetical protein